MRHLLSNIFLLLIIIAALAWFSPIGPGIIQLRQPATTEAVPEVETEAATEMPIAAPAEEDAEPVTDGPGAEVEIAGETPTEEITSEETTSDEMSGEAEEPIEAPDEAPVETPAGDDTVSDDEVPSEDPA